MKKGLHWFRRDLRLEDNHSLHEATSLCDEVYLIFIFDTNILRKLEKDDKRVSFIYDSIVELNESIQKRGGGGLITYIGDPCEIIPRVSSELGCDIVFANEDYEDYAIKRDLKIKNSLGENGVDFQSFQDHVLYRGDEILKNDGTPYKVFTPYKNKWLSQIYQTQLKNYQCNQHRFSKQETKICSLEEVGFSYRSCSFIAGEQGARNRLSVFLEGINEYHLNRDEIYLDCNSKLSVYLRFGNISIREVVRNYFRSESQEGAKVWLSEIIWRDFFYMILFNFPHVEKQSYLEKYRKISWPGSEEHFEAWKNGQTGFPLVDAAMRHLNETGEMHNRLRMVTASFLTKDLLVSWQKGEQYFASKLLDYDLAANNGGWQWCASVGCDAQPYFRIFNPTRQSQRFDREALFITKIIPELKKLPVKYRHAPSMVKKEKLIELNFDLDRDYLRPIVDHKMQRVLCKELFKC